MGLRRVGVHSCWRTLYVKLRVKDKTACGVHHFLEDFCEEAPGGPGLYTELYPAQSLLQSFPELYTSSAQM